MSISKSELLYIAKLAKLRIKDEEIDEYLKNLEDILNFANTLNNADTNGLDETIGSNENKNVFRKDNASIFKDNQSLLLNAVETEKNMYKIPKVIN
ncbi:MAG: Asp-tRNA(Asn)/Glu-tRNA(Gln) amidotransferase subunit GatC [Clostridiales bacterium]|nr:Asp-tRNA(Asn)/Glu-tRNA(Gln) amidotransferase subunit GatC [Clostridiales bacterium]